MSRKSKAIDIWRQMKPATLRKLAVAVFLMFGVLGPLIVLMQSAMVVLSWGFIIVETIACGGLAASIVLFARGRWWVFLLEIFFWGGVLTLNSGEVSIGYYANEGFRVHLGKMGENSFSQPSIQSLTLQPYDLDAIYTQRAIVGLLAIALLATGYTLFIKIIRAEVRQRARLETEVNIAKDIQKSLQPSDTFQNSWCMVVGTTIPASEVGGDFFDVIELSDNRVAIAIADVTGHGVGAGILSAMTKSALHSQLQHDASPISVLSNLNGVIYQVSEDKMFVTFAYVLLDKTTNSLSIATAGHPPVLYRQSHAKRVHELRTVSLALGLQEQVQFNCVQMQFTSGDALLLYTDGVVEAMNHKGEQFGDEQLHRIFSSTDGSAEKICSGITIQLQRFSDTDVFQDDVSLVCVKLN